ncbi:MAG: EpsI family protein [Pseudomonadota bacterium]|nr:EpsI family protein [Pseudomonadota bacterium]
MSFIKVLIISFLLVFALWFSEYIKPTINSSEEASIPSLEKIIPPTFQNWKQLDQGLPLIVSLEEQNSLDAIYSQTLSQVYYNDAGARIILSLAYGPNQTDPKRVHKPEVCYPAQGYNIESNELGMLQTDYLTIPVKYLKGVSAAQTEFITYWIVVGGVAVSNDVDFKVQQLKFALDGKVPDGLLFRVSSHGKEAQDEYEKQKAFINDLLMAVDDDTRTILIGANNQ